MTNRYICCSLCKGRAPYPEICAHKKCACHEIEKDFYGDEKPVKLTYNDPTPRAALWNMGAMRGKK